MSIIIRQGIKADLPQVLELIKELAEFEREPHEVENTLEQLEEDGFGKQPVFEFFVAEDQESKKMVGLALYFYSYSTWKGKCIYLEDLIVTQLERGKGIGKRLLDRIIVKAKEENCYRVVWQVLDWNEPAIKFYKSLGADIPKEWLTCRLVKKQIDSYVPME
ncbi:GNAT family N-acetyltransferase [Catalinimonas niigatensis]|uniref:GNAT family N-acetyltransferase n=1 Tax=Catalinimonas niigatensis TaxID=1397264 RepID=UPI0026654F77|nr:GNAT family N-acetyltransferase [Catalinimonas niigatensis]WPP53573.1 GNAT family N-acetyltransferase [Catalinimonas niigatensis]